MASLQKEAKMSLVSINDVLKITTRVEKIHPYKVVGDRDSYSPYNEGWNDCVSLIESYLEKMPVVEPKERTAKVKESWGLAMCCACEKRVFPYDKYCSHCGARLEWE